MSVNVNKCECGYEPDKEYNPKNFPRECTSTTALCNHITFPSQKLLPNGFLGGFKCKYNLYYDNKINAINYWVVLIELDRESFDHSSIFPRSDWVGHNMYGEVFQIMVYEDCQSEREYPKLFSFSDFQKGHTIAVYQPNREMGNSIVLNFTNFDTCMVFKTGMDNVYAEAKCLLQNADSKANNDLLECHTCGLKSANLSGCGKCKLARYCSKECQIKGWTKHKNLCSHNDMLLRLSSLPRHKYVHDFQNFNRNFPLYKPPVKKTDTDLRAFKTIQNQNGKSPHQDKSASNKKVISGNSNKSSSIDKLINMLKSVK